MDAFLLGTLIALPLIYTGVVLTFPLLIIPGYVLVFLISLTLRRRKAATSSLATESEAHGSPLEYTPTATLAQSWTRFQRGESTRIPPEKYS